MAWEHLDVNRPHLVYIILGGFTSLFMLCSSVIKERLYIGEATVATLCGIIFGPHAANLINPGDWGNTDQITLEFARIVLVVQCFAVGVELPRSYMERHWKSVTLLLVPVMTFGWLITSLFIWWLFGSKLNWLDALCISACVTATDPVLASSVVGKGKFAKRVPKHLRDLLSAESGCNDGMAFPFIYLAIYLIRYRPDAGQVSYHWFCYTILYECVFGCTYGVLVGYLARRAIRAAHERDLIDRESFLVFYFVLALFCAGSGSILGVDDLLVGFSCGVGFSNDGWFQEKTEESHVSNVIDLLINLAFFVYFGTIIPWEQYNSSVLGISPWRLVVLGIMVIFFRRIPIMLALKPLIPDVKTWREALFAGHFGPIGVGAIFVAILARAELETESTTPLAVIPADGFEHLNIIELVWPITTFLVIVSIIIHGSSIAVFTLGRHINTLAISVSFTKANEEGPSWMDRLPRIQSRSKSSMSARRPDGYESSFDEKLEEGMMSPSGLPKGFLRRLKDEDAPSRSSSRRSNKRKKWDAGRGPGGPVSESAIKPAPRSSGLSVAHTDSDTLAMNSDESPDGGKRSPEQEENQEEIYREGSKDIIEDEEGNVLEVRDSRKGETTAERNESVQRDARGFMADGDIKNGVSKKAHDHKQKLGKDDGAEEEDIGAKLAEQLSHASTRQAGGGWRQKLHRVGTGGALTGLKKREDTTANKVQQQPEKKHGPALAYQFGNTIIVEDEDGEVIKKYDIPAQSKAARPGASGERRASYLDPNTRQRMQRMGTWMGMGNRHGAGPADSETTTSDPEAKKKAAAGLDQDDERIRFTVTAGGRRMSKADFIQAVSRLDPKSRQRLVDESDAPEALKREAVSAAPSETSSMREPRAAVHRVDTEEERPTGPDGLTLVDSNNEDIPFHPVSDTLAQFSMGQETAAQRRRRRASGAISEEHEGEDQGPIGPPRGRPRASVSEANSETAAERRRRLAALSGRGSAEASTSPSSRPVPHVGQSYLENQETGAERRRRLAALGDGETDESSSDEEEVSGGGFREPGRTRGPRRPEEAHQREARGTGGPSIRFAEGQEQGHHQRTSSGMRLRWGADVGTKPGEGGAGGKKK